MNMKLFILILIFANQSFAIENWAPIGKSGDLPRYTKKHDCERIEARDCFEISKKDPRFHEVETQTVDDMAKPIYKPKYNLESCSSPEDCQSKMASVGASCSNGDYANYEKNQVMPGYSIFCMGISGYEQKTIKVLVENSALKASVLAADAEKKTLETQISTMSKHIAFGNRMIALIGARNVSKNLTTAQVKQVVESYSTIQSLLSSGSLLTAKAEIEAITPDGTLITQADKDAILGELNAYLGQ